MRTLWCLPGYYLISTVLSSDGVGSLRWLTEQQCPEEGQFQAQLDLGPDSPQPTVFLLSRHPPHQFCLVLALLRPVLSRLNVMAISELKTVSLHFIWKIWGASGLCAWGHSSCDCWLSLAGCIHCQLPFPDRPAYLLHPVLLGPSSALPLHLGFCLCKLGFPAKSPTASPS